ncbi:putative uncharacterized protein [Waddlia chondrophila 2032/99]|uniref:Ras-GEF domain-containing protein n=1 Tax=Waddlia chondrophila 2032/99 TaxID=765953 RepID=F8LDH2_9BACT|nr:putative uncharacterized protein [Waddlia chondrophila 2032/99]
MERGKLPETTEKVVSFSPVPQTKREKLKQVKERVLQFVSRSANFLIEKFKKTDHKTKTPSIEIELDKIRKSDESDELDKEIGREFTRHVLSKKSGTDEFDHTTLSLEVLEKIASETLNIDGKVKIRKEKGEFLIRAGHRIGKPGKKEKGTGTKGKSRQAMETLLKACQHHYSEIKDQHKLYDALSEKLGKMSEDKEGFEVDKWISEVETALRVIKDSPELGNLEKALKNYKENGGEESFSKIKEAKKELETQVETKFNSLDQKFKKITEIITLLTVSTWGKAIMENHSGTLKPIISGIQPLKASKDKWLKIESFFDKVFNPEKKEFRSDFEVNYRWMMKSSEYLNLLNDRYQKNKEKIEKEEISKEDKIKLEEEQKIILEMASNWSSQYKIDLLNDRYQENKEKIEKEEISKEDKIKLEGEQKIILEMLSRSSQEVNIEGFNFLEHVDEDIKKALQQELSKTIDESETTPEKDLDFQTDLAGVAAGKIIKKEREELLNEYLADITAFTSNTYLKILPSEFFANVKWGKLSLTSPNLSKFISQFNGLNQYFQYMILTVPDGKGARRVSNAQEQAHMIGFLIDLQTKALEQGDLNTVMVIQSAFSGSSIVRLKKAWDQVPEKKLKQQKINASRIDTSLSYKAAREFLEANPKGIPYAGIFLQDLTFLKDGNKLYDEKRPGEVNNGLMADFSKTTTTALQGQQGRKMMRPKRNIEKEIEIASGQNDISLYDLSLEAQPRAQPRAKTQ